MATPSVGLRGSFFEIKNFLKEKACTKMIVYFRFPDQDYNNLRYSTYIFGEAPVPQAPKSRLPARGPKNFECDFINKSVIFPHYSV